MTTNTGSAILIIGTLWFGYQHGFEWWHYGLSLFGIITWVIATGSDQAKELMSAKAEYYRAKTRSMFRAITREKPE